VRYIWAASVELWFYVIYAAVFFTCLRYRKSDRDGLLIFCVALVGVCAARRSEITWIFQFWMAPYFLLGIALNWFVTNRIAVSPIHTKAVQHNILTADSIADARFERLQLFDIRAPQPVSKAIDGSADGKFNGNAKRHGKRKCR
jgi:hypothetical protein